MPAIHLPTGKPKPRLIAYDRVMTVKEWCERSAFSTVTGWRLLKAGLAPKVTEISGRRLGIRETDFVAWLNSRPARPGARKSK